MGSYEQRIQKIAIIGAGPSGLAAAKYLLAEQASSQITMFEQRPTVGGIWNLSPSTAATRGIPIPQLDPHYDKGNGGGLELESPLYDYLETNIPKPLMRFSDYPFKDDLQLFPRHEDVLGYLDGYADEVRHLIRFGVQVIDVRIHDGSAAGRERWDVTMREVATGIQSKNVYDAVVVANGHYTVPFVPDITGIKAWNERYPGVVMHSKAYRKPEEFKEKKVLVVGDSVSGTEIGWQIAEYCQKPLLMSSRHERLRWGEDGAHRRENVGEVVEFILEGGRERAVRFKDGRIEDEIDCVLYATGYYFNFPFLQGVKGFSGGDGWRVKGIYKHLFSIEYPTLVFPVLAVRVIPFPLVENQMAVVARVWSGRLDLPSQEKMREEEQEEVERRGMGRSFHILTFPQDAEYLNELYDWTRTAKKVDGLENDGVGKLGTFWAEQEVWWRSELAKIKGAFQKKGKDRHEVRMIEDLGFVFDKERAGKEDEWGPSRNGPTSH